MAKKKPDSASGSPKSRKTKGDTPYPGVKLVHSGTASSKSAEFIIDDETINQPGMRDYLFRPRINGEKKGHGYDPRSLALDPPGMFMPVTDLKTLSDSEIAERIDTQERDGSHLEAICEWVSLDQNSQGYCWAYSSTGCMMAVRSLMNLSPVRLSAHAVAWKIKGGRDEGGWCGLSAKFIRETGVPTVELWPEKSMSRSHDKPETWANAKLHVAQEVWQDVGGSLYDQNFSMSQLYTLLVTNQPCATDYNFWGHSVMAGRVVKVESGSFGTRIRNSWGQNWGEKGWATLRGSKARPDSAICLRVTGATQI